MGHNRFTYANNSRRVLAPTQIYLVGTRAQHGDLALSLLQTGSLGLSAGRPAVRDQLKSMKQQILKPKAGRFQGFCTAIARQVADRVGSRIGQSYLKVIFVRRAVPRGRDH